MLVRGQAWYSRIAWFVYRTSPEPRSFPYDRKSGFQDAVVFLFFGCAISDAAPGSDS